MFKRIIAIFSIFLFASVAWVILGATIFSRTYSSDSSSYERVTSLWGAAHNQTPPSASCEQLVPKTVETMENGIKRTRTEQEKITLVLPIESSRINVGLDLEHRQKGLLWYSTYKVSYSGIYTFRNTTDQDKITFTLNFPTSSAIYDDLLFTVDDTPVTLTNAQNTTSGTA